MVPPRDETPISLRRPPRPRAQTEPRTAPGCVTPLGALLVCPMPLADPLPDRLPADVNPHSALPVTPTAPPEPAPDRFAPRARALARDGSAPVTRAPDAAGADAVGHDGSGKVVAWDNGRASACESAWSGGCWDATGWEPVIDAAGRGERALTPCRAEGDGCVSALGIIPTSIRGINVTKGARGGAAARHGVGCGCDEGLNSGVGG